MSKLDQVKIPLGVQKEKYSLVRKRDGLTKYGFKIQWLEFNSNGIGVKKIHYEIMVGTSLILDLMGVYTYTWQTTTVVEIISKTEKEVKFKTKNSEYTLTIINNE